MIDIGVGLAGIMAGFMLSSLGSFLAQASGQPIENWVNLGVGGMVAGLVLYWKRVDDRRYQSDLKEMTQSYADLLKKFIDTDKKTIEAIGDLSFVLKSSVVGRRRKTP